MKCVSQSNSTKIFRKSQGGRNTLSQYDKNLGKLVSKDHRAVESVTSEPWKVFKKAEKEAGKTERVSWKSQTIQGVMTSESRQGPSHLELLGCRAGAGNSYLVEIVGFEHLSSFRAALCVEPHNRHQETK